MTATNYITLIVAIIAILPSLIATLHALFTSQPKTTSKASNISPLKFNSIKRFSLERKSWHSYKRSYLRIIIYCILILLSLIIFVIISYVKIIGTYTEIIIPIFNALLLLIAFISYGILLASSVQQYENLGKNPDDSKYFLFQKVEIKVDGDYEALFRHLQGALKDMRVQAIEIDFNVGLLEASIIPRLLSSNKVLKIKIQQFENKSSLLEILVVDIGSKRAFRSNSKLVNRFIKQITPDEREVANLDNHKDLEGKRSWLDRILRR